jgi:hypothetical protein
MPYYHVRLRMRQGGLLLHVVVNMVRRGNSLIDTYGQQIMNGTAVDIVQIMKISCQEKRSTGTPECGCGDICIIGFPQNQFNHNRFPGFQGQPVSPRLPADMKRSPPFGCYRPGNEFKVVPKNADCNKRPFHSTAASLSPQDLSHIRSDNPNPPPAQLLTHLKPFIPHRRKS